MTSVCLARQLSRRVAILSSSCQDARPRQVSNTAKVKLTWIRPSANNISGPIEIEVKCPDVKVLKTTSAPTVTAGSTARYSIAVTAGGTAPANNVVLTDALPSGLKWTIGALMLASALPAHRSTAEQR